MTHDTTMTPPDKNLVSCHPVDVETLPELEEISERFVDGFNAYMDGCKTRVVHEVMNEEFGNLAVSKNTDFIDRAVKAIDDETLYGQRFYFISVNRKLLEMPSKG